MSKLSVIKLDKESFGGFAYRHGFSENENDLERYQAYFIESSFSYGILSPTGQMIGAFGIVVVWNGVGECWFMSTPSMNRFPKWQIKTFKSLTDGLLERGVLHRVQMNVDNDKPSHHRWARLMGFQFEGVLRQHSTEATDHASYSKIL